MFCFVLDVYSTIDDIQLDQFVGNQYKSTQNLGSGCLKVICKVWGTEFSGRESGKPFLEQIQLVYYKDGKDCEKGLYYVKYPLYLWHIDGNHKLIRCVEVLDVHVRSV